MRPNSDNNQVVENTRRDGYGPRLDKKIRRESNKRGKVKTYIIIIVVLVASVSTAISFKNYKSNKFIVSDLQYADSDVVSGQIAHELQNQSYLSLNSDRLSEELKKKNPLIKEVYVNKTLLKGLVVEIKEYNPTLVVKLDKKDQYFYTEQGKFIDYQSISKPLRVASFTGTKDDFDNISRYIPKLVEFLDKINNAGVLGKYTFDKFGNLVILTLEAKTINADLNERYLSIDEQIKVFQNALGKTTFKEIDLRFDKLVIKK